MVVWRVWESLLSGFEVDLGSLLESHAGKEIWLTFDEAGEWRLPQERASFIPSNSFDNPLTYEAEPLSETTSSSNYQQLSQSAPLDLQDYWRDLEEFRAFLDSIEQQISQRNQALLSEKSSSKGLMGFLGRIF